MEPMRLVSFLALLAAACSTAGERLPETETACSSEACEADPDRDLRDIALRVQATHRYATERDLDPYVGFFLDRAPIDEPLAIDAVTSWVCDVSAPSDYITDASQTTEVGAARRDEALDIFGCASFDRNEVIFLVDPVRDPDLAVWYHDRDVLVGHIDDYPGAL